VRLMKAASLAFILTSLVCVGGAVGAAPVYRVDHVVDGDTNRASQRAAGAARADRHARSLFRDGVLLARRVANNEEVAASGLSRASLRGTRDRPRRPVRATPALRRPRQRRAEREHPSRCRGCRCAVLLHGSKGRYATRLEVLAKRAKPRKLGLCPRTPYDPYHGVQARH
jgi:hypothetical protein